MSSAVLASDIQRHACEVFTCDVVLACLGEPHTPFGEVEERLRLLERRFSRFRADSEISALNRAGGAWSNISAEMYTVLRHALDVAVASGGLVNVAVLPSLLAAGYVESRPTHAPSDLAPEPVPPLTEVLELRRGQVRLLPGHAVDVGGLVKGMWADDVVSWLGPDAAASLGGDVSCRGSGPSGEGWPVALPDGEVLRLGNGAVATSGTAKRRWGDEAHHLIDPRTGLPSRSDVARATVIATSGACADWVSSALVIGGTAELGRLGARFDVLAWRLAGAEAR